MLKIFIKECAESVVNINDVYFNKYTFGKLEYGVAQDIIKEIDGVELTEGFKIISKFTGGELDLSKLSTGCKTVLNILYNQDKVFNISSCGINALCLIYKLSVGKAFTSSLVTPVISDIPCDIEVVADKGSGRFSSVSDMRTWYGDMYL